LDVNVVTPVGLMALKIIAWSERYPQAIKDALDIAFILRNFLDADHQSLLWKDHDDLIKEEIDYRHVGARVLGREIAKILTPHSKICPQGRIARTTGHLLSGFCRDNEGDPEGRGGLLYETGTQRRLRSVRSR
jgi:hypothetical protein